MGTGVFVEQMSAEARASAVQQGHYTLNTFGRDGDFFFIASCPHGQQWLTVFQHYRYAEVAAFNRSILSTLERLPDGLFGPCCWRRRSGRHI